MQTIIYDYLRAFRLNNIKKAMANMSWWMYLYMGFLLPLQMHRIQMNGRLLTYYVIMLPLLYCLFSNTIHRITPPKILFLCPQTAETRKKYLLYFCFFKIGVIWILTLSGMGILIVYGTPDFFSAVTYIGNMVILSLLTTGLFTKDSTVNKTIHQSVNQYKGIELTIALCSVLSIFFVAILCYNYCLDTWQIFFKWSLLILLFFVELPLIIIYIYRGKDNWKNYLTYERCISTGVTPKS